MLRIISNYSTAMLPLYMIEGTFPDMLAHDETGLPVFAGMVNQL